MGDTELALADGNSDILPHFLPWMHIYGALTQQSGRKSLDQCFSGLSFSVYVLSLEIWDYYALNNHKYFCIKLLISMSGTLKHSTLLLFVCSVP